MQLCLLLCSFWVTTLLAAAVTSQHAAPQEECRDRLQAMRDPRVARQVAECERKKGFGLKVVATLPGGDTEAAASAVEQMLIACANFTAPCARTSARRVAEELLNPGAAISDNCQREVQAVQGDAATLKVVQECEVKEGIVLEIQSRMNRGDIASAVTVAEANLKKCMKVSNMCAQQLAPIIVDNVLVQELLAPAQPSQMLKPQNMQALSQLKSARLVAVPTTKSFVDFVVREMFPKLPEEIPPQRQPVALVELRSSRSSVLADALGEATPSNAKQPVEEVDPKAAMVAFSHLAQEGDDAATRVDQDDADDSANDLASNASDDVAAESSASDVSNDSDSDSSDGSDVEDDEDDEDDASGDEDSQDSDEEDDAELLRKQSFLVRRARLVLRSE